MPRPKRRPARDLIDAVIDNMRANLEELRYTTVAPSRYTVFLSPEEHARLEGILPRLRAETIRALNEELDKVNQGGRLERAVGRFLKKKPQAENADTHWHVEFLPDHDGELVDPEDVIVQSELILPAPPELGAGERTRRVTTVHAAGQPAARSTSRHEVVGSRPVLSQAPLVALARLTYQDASGAHQYEIVGESTTIGRGGTMYPVNVRISTTDDVSREHARIRRDPASGVFFLIDLSTQGTTIDGQPVPKGFEDANGSKKENGVESPLQSRARIGLANTVFLDFEKLG